MTTTAQTSRRFAVEELPYAYDALEPALSEETLRFHHDKHYAGYVAKLDELVVDTPFADMPLEDIVASSDGSIFNNAAQAWNHVFYFASLSPDASPRPEGPLREAIVRYFGSLEELQAEMTKAAVALFGSGWVWLARDRSGRLVVLSEQNAGTPLRYGMTPLVCIDVWEHAYYIDYRNRRVDHVKALWPLIDWRTVAHRYEISAQNAPQAEAADAQR